MGFISLLEKARESLHSPCWKVTLFNPLGLIGVAGESGIGFCWRLGLNLRGTWEVRHKCDLYLSRFPALQGWPASRFAASLALEGWTSRPYSESSELPAALSPCCTSISSMARFSAAFPLQPLAWAQDSAALWTEIKGFIRERGCCCFCLVCNQKGTTHQQFLLTGHAGQWIPSFFQCLRGGFDFRMRDCVLQLSGCV